MKIYPIFILVALNFTFLSQAHPSCEDYLSTGSKTNALVHALNKAMQKPGKPNDDINETIQTIEMEMNDNNLTFSNEDKAAFIEAYRLKPLFDSGIVYDALIKELHLKGYKKSKEVKAVLNSFKLFPEEEQSLLIDKIVDRLIHMIDNNINLGNVMELTKTAKKYGMTIEELSNFISIWRQFKESDFEEVKLVLFMKLLGNDSTFTQNILKQTKWTKRLGRWLKKESNPEAIIERPQPNLNGVSQSQAWDQSPYQFEDITSYIGKASAGLVDSFLSSNINNFNLAQIDYILRIVSSEGYASEKIKISKQNQIKLKKRFDALEEIKRIKNILANLDKIDFPELEALEKEIASTEKSMKLLDQLQIVKSSQVTDLSQLKPIENIAVKEEEIEKVRLSQIHQKWGAFISSFNPIEKTDKTEENNPFNAQILNILSPSVFSSFIEESLLFLNLDQLDVLKRSEKLSTLTTELQGRISKRHSDLSSIREIQAKIKEVELREASLNKKIEFKEKRISEIDRSNGGAELTEKEFALIFDQTKTASQFKSIENIQSALKNILNTYSSRLSNKQFFEITTHIISSTETYNYGQDVINTITLAFRYCSRTIDSDYIYSFLKASIARTSKFNNIDNIFSAFKFILKTMSEMPTLTNDQLTDLKTQIIGVTKKFNYASDVSEVQKMVQSFVPYDRSWKIQDFAQEKAGLQVEIAQIKNEVKSTHDLLLSTEVVLKRQITILQSFQPAHYDWTRTREILSAKQAEKAHIKEELSLKKKALIQSKAQELDKELEQAMKNLKLTKQQSSNSNLRIVTDESKKDSDELLIDIELAESFENQETVATKKVNK